MDTFFSLFESIKTGAYNNIILPEEFYKYI